MSAERTPKSEVPKPTFEEEVDALQDSFKSLISNAGWDKTTEQGLLSGFPDATTLPYSFTYKRDQNSSWLEINSDSYRFTFDFNSMGETSIGYTDKKIGRLKILSIGGLSKLSYFENEARVSEIKNDELSKFDDNALPYGKLLLEEITQRLPNPSN